MKRLSLFQQTNATDFVPVKILTDQKNISENSDLYVTCSTFGLKKNTSVYLYLCKNDIWIDHRKQKEDRDDTLFIIRNVSLNHSGKYSCVFSIKNDLHPKAPMRGLNVIQILVIRKYSHPNIKTCKPYFSPLMLPFLFFTAQPIISLQTFQ